MTVFRKGDVVQVRGVVEYADAETLTVMVGYHKVYPKPDDVTLVQPRFDVGEWVIVKSTKDRGRIEAIVNDRAWVMRPDIACAPVHDVYPLANLERAPALVQADGESYAAAVLSVPEEPEPSFGQALANSHRDHPAEPDEDALTPCDRAVRAVLGAINADPNVNDAFKGSL
jgi:hypothetical protein